MKYSPVRLHGDQELHLRRQPAQRRVCLAHTDAKSNRTVVTGAGVVFDSQIHSVATFRWQNLVRELVRRERVKEPRAHFERVWHECAFCFQVYFKLDQVRGILSWRNILDVQDGVVVFKEICAIRENRGIYRGLCPARRHVDLAAPVFLLVYIFKYCVLGTAGQTETSREQKK